MLYYLHVETFADICIVEGLLIYYFFDNILTASFMASTLFDVLWPISTILCLQFFLFPPCFKAQVIITIANVNIVLYGLQSTLEMLFNSYKASWESEYYFYCHFGYGETEAQKVKWHAQGSAASETGLEIRRSWLQVVFYALCYPYRYIISWQNAYPQFLPLYLFPSSFFLWSYFSHKSFHQVLVNPMKSY